MLPCACGAHLDERADDAKAGQPQVLKGARLGDGVEEGVEEQGDVGWGWGGGVVEEGGVRG
jgi:hypothetical protein